MAFDPTSLQKRFYLAVQLDSGTVYFGRHYYTLDDGTVVDGLITSMSPLVRGAGSLLDPRLDLPSMIVTLDNRPDQLGTRTQDQLDATEWPNRPVEVWIGQGDAAADYEEVWEGTVKFPGGLSISDRAVTVRIVDARQKDARDLPIRVFTAALYPNLEAAALNVPIPLVYGDWTSTAGNAATLPAYQIDSTEGTGGRFKIADHALKQIEVVYKNGGSVAFTQDLANGEFVLDVAYTPGTDVVTVHCQGATDDGTPSGDLLQTAPDVFDDLHQTWLEVDSGDISSAALAAWGAELTTDDYVRRHIGTETDSSILVAELVRECLADLTVEAGEYYPRYRIVSPDEDLPVYRDGDLILQPDGTRDFFVDLDPDAIYTNQIRAQYGWDPVAESYTERYDVEDSAAIAAVRSRKLRTFTYNWLYLQAGVEVRSDRELYMFSAQAELGRIGLQADGLTIGPTGQFRLAYNRYVDVDADLGAPFQVREATTDLWNMQAQFMAWNMLLLSPGRWAPATATTWLLSTSWERWTQGYWTDDDGYADPTVPPDETSKRSIWW